MSTTKFKTHKGNASKVLKPLVLKLTRQIDDVHFFCESMLFKVFMVHEEVASGDSAFSSIYSITMRALIPNYQDVLRDSLEGSSHELYHVSQDEYLSLKGPEVEEAFDRMATQQSDLEKKATSSSIYEFKKLINLFHLWLNHFRNNMGTLHKQLIGSAEALQGRFK